MIYKCINEMYEEARKNGIIIIDEHIHDDEKGVHRAKHISIYCENGEWIVDEALSGGRNECVWNHYTAQYKYFIDALTSVIDINKPMEIIQSYMTMSDFLNRRNKISWEELTKREERLVIQFNHIYNILKKTENLIEDL